MRTDTEILHVQDFPLTIPQGTYAQIAFVVEQVEKKQSDYNQENWHFTFLPVDQISIGILENTLELDAIFIEPATMDLVKAEKLSELLGKHEIPFILYTEKFDLTAKQKAIELKLDDYLFGAFTPALLKRLQFIKKIKAYKLNRNPKTYQPVKIQPTESIKIWKLKRFSDIFLASLAIVLLSPLLIVIALIIKLESKGPIFYISKRAGSGYKIFDFYKFRSMRLGADQELKDLSHLNQYNNAANDHVFFKIKDDPRVTSFGLFLRNSSLDELPQLFNVLKGDMSLVGNRPLPLYEAERLTKDQIAWRFVAPAGITGLWQVTKRGNKEMSLDERIHLDMEYAMKKFISNGYENYFFHLPRLVSKRESIEALPLDNPFLMLLIEFLLLTYFVYVVAYTTVFSMGGLFYSMKYRLDQKEIVFRKFWVLIPCYKEDQVIIDVAKKALEQSYPAASYTVVVIADSLQPKTLTMLRQLPIRVIEVNFESSTKVKSLNVALQALPDDYDYAVILDADNVMAFSFLERMNESLSSRVRAIQGQRKPKNQNNSLAILDGVSEAINNHIYRQGTVALGLSSSISGSGVAFDFHLLKEKLSSMNSVGGFDRELEVLLLTEGIKVAYHKEAIVYDEKVSKDKTFQNQRKRWISSQYVYLGKYFSSGIKALAKGNFTYFNSTVLRNIQLPRLINIGLLTFLTLTLYFVRGYLYLGYTIWLTLFALNTISILLAIPGEFYNRKLAMSILKLPVLFLNMVLLLFKLKGANKKFIHTPHGVSSATHESIK